MIRVHTQRIVDYVVIGISGLSFLLCLGCALYAVPWNKKRRKQDVTKEFNVFWKTRLILQVASAVWLLVQWLRLEALWQPGSRIFPSRVTSWTGNGTLCRLYICISMGLLEPFCLFMAVLLCRGVLSKRRPKVMGWPNAWVIGLALLLVVPFLAAQTVTAWMSVIIPGHQWEQQKKAGTYFLASYVDGTEALCDNSDGQICLLCFFPAASNIVACLSSFLAALLLWICTQKMINTVINRRLRCRLRAFQLMMITVLVAMNATRAATIVRGTPFAWAFEILWLAHFLTIPVLVAVYSIFLVIIPVWDTWKAARGIEKFNKDVAGQTKLPGSRRNEGPALPRPSTERPQDTMLNVEQDKTEVTGGSPSRI